MASQIFKQQSQTPKSEEYQQKKKPPSGYQTPPSSNQLHTEPNKNKIPKQRKHKQANTQSSDISMASAIQKESILNLSLSSDYSPSKQGTARLKDLCQEDKAKIGDLLKKLSTEKENKQALEDQIKQKEIQHQEILDEIKFKSEALEQENLELQKKLQNSLEIMREYKQTMQNYQLQNFQIQQQKNKNLKNKTCNTEISLIQDDSEFSKQIYEQYKIKLQKNQNYYSCKYTQTVNEIAIQTESTFEEYQIQTDKSQQSQQSQIQIPTLFGDTPRVIYSQTPQQIYNNNQFKQLDSQQQQSQRQSNTPSKQAVDEIRNLRKEMDVLQSSLRNLTFESNNLQMSQMSPMLQSKLTQNLQSSQTESQQQSNIQKQVPAHRFNQNQNQDFEEQRIKMEQSLDIIDKINQSALKTESEQSFQESIQDEKSTNRKVSFKNEIYIIPESKFEYSDILKSELSQSTQQTDIQENIPNEQNQKMTNMIKRASQDSNEMRNHKNFETLSSKQQQQVQQQNQFQQSLDSQNLQKQKCEVEQENLDLIYDLNDQFYEDQLFNLLDQIEERDVNRKIDFNQKQKGKQKNVEEQIKGNRIQVNQNQKTKMNKFQLEESEEDLFFQI